MVMVEGCLAGMMMHPVLDLRSGLVMRLGALPVQAGLATM